MGDESGEGIVNQLKNILDKDQTETLISQIQHGDRAIS